MAGECARAVADDGWGVVLAVDVVKAGMWRWGVTAGVSTSGAVIASGVEAGAIGTKGEDSDMAEAGRWSCWMSSWK